MNLDTHSYYAWFAHRLARLYDNHEGDCQNTGEDIEWTSKNRNITKASEDES